MANLVAYIEVREGAITAPSCFALAQARRVADGLGATVYALAALAPTEEAALDALAGKIGSAGADRILCCTDAAFAGPALDASHGGLLAAVADRLRPNLFLFPAGGCGAELGPPLAVRSGAAFVPCAALEIENGTGARAARLVLRCWRAGFDGQRAIDLHELERPAIATLAAGRTRQPLGEPAAEMELLACPPPLRPLPSLIADEADPAAGVGLADTVVLLADEVDAAMLDKLRAALPAGTPVLAGADPRCAALARACPERLLIVTPSASRANWPLPGLAPGARVALLAGKGDKSAPFASVVARADKGSLAGLVAAVEAAASKGALA